VNGFLRGDRISREVAHFETAAFVLVHPDDPETIVGYYALSNTAIKRAHFSNKERRSLGYQATPGAIIGYLGVDKRFQGHHLGVYILKRALCRCLGVSSQCGCAFVVLDVEVKNERAISMYTKAGFKEFKEPPEDEGGDEPGRPEKKKLYITMSNVKAAVEQGL